MGVADIAATREEVRADLDSFWKGPNGGKAGMLLITGHLRKLLQARTADLKRLPVLCKNVLSHSNEYVVSEAYYQNHLRQEVIRGWEDRINLVPVTESQWEAVSGNRRKKQKQKEKEKEKKKKVQEEKEKDWPSLTAQNKN